VFPFRSNGAGNSGLSYQKSMNTPFHIRLARREDAATVAELNCRLAHETERRQLDKATVLAGVTRLLETPHAGFYYVAASAQQQVVGCLMVTFEWSDWRDGVFWWIQSVYVRPDWRRQGVFRLLFDEVQRQARAAGNVCGLRLYVEQENAVAQRTYADLGMAPTPYRMLELEFSRGTTESV
jgi:ribosomal protein S18 acetylase RimI-like enzyme